MTDRDYHTPDCSINNSRSSEGRRGSAAKSPFSSSIAAERLKFRQRQSPAPLVAGTDTPQVPERMSVGKSPCIYTVQPALIEDSPGRGRIVTLQLSSSDRTTTPAHPPCQALCTLYV